MMKLIVVENYAHLRRVKKDFQFEFFLNAVPILKHRQAVTRLRISAHKLPVECGRYKNIPYDLRLCNFCDLNEVGDEYHYLFRCKNNQFVNVRNNFLNDLKEINSSFDCLKHEDLFLYILSMKDKSISNLVAKYCFNILTTFENCIIQ